MSRRLSAVAGEPYSLLFVFLINIKIVFFLKLPSPFKNIFREMIVILIVFYILKVKFLV